MMPRGMPSKPQTIWCDHCNAEISISGVRSCLRQTCQTKEMLPDTKKGTNA